ncbi:DUF4097 family beta strand repeat-containing protein [Streptomyces sp. SL203]|nr:DUF4097 family beta strand repeat-containing protein [Streptomyces sp. SL203]MCY1649227.1 DUF4097 family beta strand repeat-containing protein [Streptomyces sp. SL203]
MTEKTHTAAPVGPLLLDVTTDGGEVRVRVDAAATAAHVVIRTADEDGPAAEAVRGARIIQDGQRLAVVVPKIEGADGTVTIGNMQFNGGFGGGVHVMQNVTTVGRGQTMTGVTIVNGQVIGGGMSGGTVVRPVEVLVTLPAGSGVQMKTKNANLTVTGPLAALAFDGYNGNVRAGLVGRIKAKSYNGDIEADGVREFADVETYNGDVEIGSYGGGAARLVTYNGDVRLSASPSAAGELAAQTYNGDVRLRGTSGRPELNVSAKTRNGRVSK